MNHESQETVDITKIALPSWSDIIQLCRLLFQSLVNLRLGLADGQHRICAMMNLLSGWSITVQTTTVPPKTFERGNHFRIIDYDKQPDNSAREVAAKEAIDKFLPLMIHKVNHRIVLVQTTAELVSSAVNFSQVREQSQAKHKPRVLVDV